MHHRERLEITGAQRLVAADQILERPEHQRERGAQLVADIGEERSLRAVQSCECLRSPSFVLVCPAALDSNTERRARELYEGPVGLVGRAMWANAHNQKSN